jgi:hypothetical protein
VPNRAFCGVVVFADSRADGQVGMIRGDDVPANGREVECRVKLRRVDVGHRSPRFAAQRQPRPAAIDSGAVNGYLQSRQRGRAMIAAIQSASGRQSGSASNSAAMWREMWAATRLRSMARATLPQLVPWRALTGQGGALFGGLVGSCRVTAGKLGLGCLSLSDQLFRLAARGCRSQRQLGEIRFA